MRLIRSALKRLALFGLGVVIPLGLFELGIRILAPQDLDFYNGEKFMRLSVRPGQGLEFIPNSSNESYIGVPVRINSRGLRDREFAVPKPDGVFRIVALGDSVTFGFGVKLEETYAKRLEARLNARLGGANGGFEVVNTGIEATGLDYYTQFLRTAGALLEPDLVLVGIVLNDIDVYNTQLRAENRSRVTIASTLARINRFMRSQSHVYAYSYMNLKSTLYKTGILDINRQYGNNFLTFERPSPRQERAWNSSFEQLNRLIEAASNLGVPLVLVTFPMEFQLSREARDLYGRALGIRLDDNAASDAPQRRLAEFARGRNVPFVDLLPPFRDSQSRGLFLQNRVVSHDWVHPSKVGHDVAADEIFQKLIQFKLIPLTNRPHSTRLLTLSSEHSPFAFKDRGRR